MDSNADREKPWKKQFDSFMKEPNRDNLRTLIEQEAIEDNDLDFKRELIKFDELAKHILAMANKSGGAIIFGVEEVKDNQFYSCGLNELPDITKIEKSVKNYIPNKLEFDSIPYHFSDDSSDLHDKFFLVIVVYYNPKYIPFVALKESTELKRNTIYIRRNRASEPINHEELQEILSKRIETEYSVTDERKLIEHLEELKELYKYIPKTINKLVSYSPPKTFLSLPTNIMMAEVFGKSEYKNLPNPDYPEESYESFIAKIIDIKKNVIIDLVGK
jgi:predicted HTH transcriptional regulator